MLQYSEFFSNLSHRVESARRLERELDRRLARRFNVFEYLSTDELGLSRVIGELLNSDAAHGQGTFFLERFLHLLRESIDINKKLEMVSSPVLVEVERVITDQRRIDVFVQLSDGNADWVLAIENKPFAGDQSNQVRDYLKYLDERFGSNYMLIYLSPRGQGPSETSVSLNDLKEKWGDRFRILSYGTTGNTVLEDNFSTFRIAHSSLIEWLQSCQRECDVDRIRWFLGDLVEFSRRRFGA